MYAGKFIFSQLVANLPMHTFRQCVARYQGERYVKQFRCLDQYLVMAFAQLTSRSSLRDIEACLCAHKSKLYHMGIRSSVVARNTLSKANERRDWRIYADFAQSLIRTARPLYAKEDLGLDLDNTIYALDASTIDLCLSVFPWALFRSTKSAVKLHTLLDLRGNIPTFIHISDGKLHDVNVLDILLPEPGAFYIMDRGYVDFKRLFTLNIAGAFFVIRAKSNTKYRRRYSRSTEESSAVKCDQTIALTGSQHCIRLPATITTCQILRRSNRENIQLPNQQLRDSCTDSCRPVSQPMAGRTFLQMDQATLTNEIFLWHIRERCQKPDMDCYFSLRTHCNNQEATRPQDRSLHNVTDFKSDTVRENFARTAI